MTNVLALGQSQTAEMIPLADFLQKRVASHHLRFQPDVASALELAKSEWHPDLIVIFQNWPDEFTHENIRKLFSSFPLARWICCFGLWCESDGRNRDFWPLSTRVFARNAIIRIERELANCDNNRSPLPFTAGREEIFEYENSYDDVHPGNGETILVISPDRELRDWLADLLNSSGYSPMFSLKTGTSPDAILWDVDPLTERTRNELIRHKNNEPDMPIIPLMNFTHPEDSDFFREQGIPAAVAKLAPDRHLLDTLKSALRQCSLKPGNGS